MASPRDLGPKPRSKLMCLWSVLTVGTLWFVWSSSVGSQGNAWQMEVLAQPATCRLSATRELEGQSEGNVTSGCPPQRRVVFIKTHKTASSTTASILERFGYQHNLSFAVRPFGHILTDTSLFHRSVVADQEPRSRPASPDAGNCTDDGADGGFDMLTNHARYNRPEMEAVVHRAKYVTILREPVAQFESAFAYFQIADKLGLSKYDNPIEEFMKQPQVYLNRRTFDYYWQSMRNQQIFDLGLDHSDHDNDYIVDYKISTLGKELDLVMMTEYYHESLILLKKLLCWSFEDILYLSNGVRNSKHRYTITPELHAKIHKWNCADVKLYDYFNRTFWRRVEQYGPDFEQDLETFRRKQQKLTEECIDFSQTVEDDRELRYNLRQNASALCHDILRGDVGYTSLIQDRMRANGQVSSKFSLQYLRDIYYSILHS